MLMRLSRPSRRATRHTVARGVVVALAAAFFPLLSKKILATRPVVSPSEATFSPVGLWHAALVPAPDYPVFFDVRVVAKGSGLSASLLNGASEIPFTSAAWDGAKLTLELAHYDAKIVAEPKGPALEGRYTRVIAAGLAEVPFRASRKAPAAPTAKGDVSLDGSWGVEMGGAKSVEKMTGVLRQKGSAVMGTFLSTTGDYGALHGTFDGERLVLTVFDGVNVYRFDAELLPDGRLAGEYRSRTNPPVSWSGKRLDAAAAATFLPGSFDIVKPKDPSQPYVVSFPDVEGRIISTADARFAGKPMLVAFMGTWCPNCADEAPFLREIEEKYGPRGLEIVSLSFEYTDDVERNRRQVKRFVERFGTRHPILLAGTTKGAPASPATLPLQGWEGYPTTLFLDRSHRIVKIHSGFDGPATGERFAKEKREIEGAVEMLLKTTG
jgi:thiol-disulfide isomerase/thioredoxin